jgi:hypothetical protein
MIGTVVNMSLAGRELTPLSALAFGLLPMRLSAR